MTAQEHVEIVVNGVAELRSVPASRLLRDYIRDDVGLTGTKGACEDGMCGACSVLLNGELVKSCLVLARSADGKAVTTVEGLEAPDGRLHPVQQAILDEFALQCGFCTPGLAMTMVGLLEEGTTYDDESGREALVGNICRCTGYTTIISALLSAQERRDEAQL
jgi:aerobic carbon-monoxide dehydrogenase small subunit